MLRRRRRESSIVLVFETHSTSTDNERWIASGWHDPRLSQLGRRQAKELGERRAGEEVAAVFTSDLGRAVETARIAFAERGIPIFIDWRLRECNYGELNGAPVAQVEAERLRHVYEPFPGGESYNQVVERVRGFLHDLPPRFEARRLVVVGHTATKWALDHLVEGIPLKELVGGSFHWQPGWRYSLEIDV
jgi:broad specificity phosphatase PhoE